MKRLSMRVCLLLVACLAGLAVCRADELAAVTGLVTDPNGRSVPGVTVIITNLATNVASRTVTNDQGIYRVPSLQPGIYRITIDKDGFKSIVKSGIELHVQDVASINFELQIGSVNETVTVEAGGLVINTTDATVGTVVDRKYVENMPLNGRSFQDLILLTPGVVTSSPNSPLASGGVNTHGEFSVNGQRAESNYYTLDGVSANSGIVAGNPRAATSGSLPVSTILGTTQGLVSVDALEEFRVQSSTYSAEYGRNPGGQFSFVTRSGTNQWHGNAFDYLRNNFFDANDWFNNFFSKPLAALRQNDFGGTLGGPLGFPHVYNGKNKTFFFFSYEGLRLLQPQAATPSFVPDLCMRGAGPCPTSGPGAGRQPAASALLPIVNAFPLPSPNGVEDAANGIGQFIGTWSNPSSVDSTSVRFDHVVSDKLRLFFRFSNTASTTTVREASNSLAGLFPFSYTTRSYTGGATSAISSRVSNEFRLNYTSNESLNGPPRVTNFGGAQPVDILQLQGVDSRTYPFAQVDVFFNAFGADFAAFGQQPDSGKQRQWNLVDALSVSFGRHQIRAGVDFRRLAPIINSNTPIAQYLFISESSVEANTVDFGQAISNAPAHPVYTNYSAFAQDDWRITPRLSLSMGLRWEVNPAPGGKTSNRPYVVQGSTLSTLTLAPQGTPLWNTAWYNFAPRLGAVYIVRNTPGFETVVRGGGGVHCQLFRHFRGFCRQLSAPIRTN